MKPLIIYVFPFKMLLHSLSQIQGRSSELYFIRKYPPHLPPLGRQTHKHTRWNHIFIAYFKRYASSYEVWRSPIMNWKATSIVRIQYALFFSVNVTDICQNTISFLWDYSLISKICIVYCIQTGYGPIWYWNRSQADCVTQCCACLELNIAALSCLRNPRLSCFSV
jgi:hypothetical protein